MRRTDQQCAVFTGTDLMEMADGDGVRAAIAREALRLALLLGPGLPEIKPDHRYTITVMVEEEDA